MSLARSAFISFMVSPTKFISSVTENSLRFDQKKAATKAAFSFWKNWSGKGDLNPRPSPWQGKKGEEVNPLIKKVNWAISISYGLTIVEDCTSLYISCYVFLRSVTVNPEQLSVITPAFIFPPHLQESRPQLPPRLRQEP